MSDPQSSDRPLETDGEPDHESAQSKSSTSKSAAPATRQSLTRRRVLRASATGAGVLAIGSARGHGDEASSTTDYCAETTRKPHMIPYDEAGIAACASDHPRSQQLQADVAAAFEERFPTVGSLIDDGFVPYFDFVDADEGSGISHWLNPEYLGDETVLDPRRPESVLVDHKWWRPVGVMYIATRNGQVVDPPPAIYPADDGGEEDGGSDGRSDDDEVCLPWHAHVGLPGRKSWWKYRMVYGDGKRSLREGLPCRTPWMMHVWALPHPEGVYAHGPLPRGHRGGPPAEPAGFETDAVPGEDELDERILLEAAGDRFHDRLRHLRADVDERLEDMSQDLDDRARDWGESMSEDVERGLGDLQMRLEDLG